MTRGLIAGGLSVAIQAGALCAPLVHAHLDEHHADHHLPYGVHAHVNGHGGEDHRASAETSAVHSEDDPEQITEFQIFVAVDAAAAAELPLPPVRFALLPPLESTLRRPPDVVRSHSPPDRSLADSRAPPAWSVLI